MDKTNSFLDFYNCNIAPALIDIDIFFKTRTPLNINSVSSLLSIPVNEVINIMAEEKILALNKNSFFRIMRKGSSTVCRIFDRELKCGLPKSYTPADISYIYNIELDDILEACGKLGINEINSETLKIVFENIECPYIMS